MAAHKFFALILPLCTFLLALGFATCWRWKPQQRDLLWMAGCFGLFSTGVAAQILAIPAALDTNAVLSAALYHAAVWCQAEAMTQRFGVRMARQTAAVVGTLALGALSYYAYVDDQLYVRIYVLNFGLAAQLGLSTWLVWQVRTHQRLERALQWLFAVFVLSFFVRTALTIPPAQGLTPDNFAFTTFWVVLQLSLLLFAMLFAMLYLALAIQQALAQLHEERNRDPLTQLLNRRAFREAVQHLEPHPPLGTVVLCDIDHFKQVNDQWGHAAGDAVLHQVAQVLQGQVRHSDVVARFGGEEFVVLLRGMPLAASAQWAQRVAQQLATLCHPALPPHQRVTASFGVAEVTTVAQLDAAIAQADHHLYAAKAAGRNCVHWPGCPPAALPPS